MVNPPESSSVTLMRSSRSRTENKLDPITFQELLNVRLLLPAAYPVKYNISGNLCLTRQGFYIRSCCTINFLEWLSSLHKNYFERNSKLGVNFRCIKVCHWKRPGLSILEDASCRPSLPSGGTGPVTGVIRKGIHSPKFTKWARCSLSARCSPSSRCSSPTAQLYLLLGPQNWQRTTPAPSQHPNTHPKYS